MTWNLILKVFFSLLILVDEALYLKNPIDATLASLSVLKYSRWHPKWPPVFSLGLYDQHTRSKAFQFDFLWIFQRLNVTTN